MKELQWKERIESMLNIRGYMGKKKFKIKKTKKEDDYWIYRKDGTMKSKETGLVYDKSFLDMLKTL